MFLRKLKIINELDAILSKKLIVLNEFDDIFKKLLNVVPQNLSREETRTYLKEFILEELPEVEGSRADLFKRPNCVPTNVLYVYYGTRNKALKSTLDIGYPPNIRKIASQAHRKMMFKKLDSLLDEKFARGVNSDNVVYWQKGFTIIGKNLKTMKNDSREVLCITLESFDTRIFPLEDIFDKLGNKNERS